MKTKYFFLAAIGALTLASCSNDELVGDNSPTLGQEGDGSIQFGFDMHNTTRADKVGSDAATVLQSQFIVYGTKHTSAEAISDANDEVVFKNYKVEYTANTAGHTTSNTHNWEYVGLTPYASGVTPIATSQSIKYWDYSAAQGYTFYGIASKADITAGHVTVDKITSVTSPKTVYDKGYTVTLDKDATLNDLYVADRKPVARGEFGKPVTLTFRNFGARVRVGFYETIPGYSVTINKFYYDSDAGAAVASFTPMTDANTTNFTAALQNISKTPVDGSSNPTTNSLTLSYYDNTVGAIENHVKLTPSTVDYDYALTLGTGVVGTVLKETSATPTWDNSGNYTPVFPFEDNNNPMLIKVDYTLTSLDGSAETIEVKGATAVVPTQFVKWKSNFAYTYIFKISDNSNGKTDESYPAGLYPITFDAVVIDVADDKTQETITTFEDYSLTSYSNGSKVTVDNEYKKSNDIYVVKTRNSDGAIVAQSAIGDDAVNKAQVYTVSSSGDAISEATITAKLNGAPNGLTLTAVTPVATLAASAPAADGTTYQFGTGGAVKFTPGAADTYAYVSVNTVNVPATYSAVSSGEWSNTTTYYFKTSENVYYPAEGINAGNFGAHRDAGNLYTQTSAGTAGVYSIKIIKVVD